MENLDIKSQDELYPTFPYVTADQLDLKTPDYEMAAESGAELAQNYGLIRSYRWQEYGENKIMIIKTETGEIISLSAMQATLLIKGIFLGYRRDREISLGFESQLQSREKIELEKRIPRSKRKSIPIISVHDKGISVPSRGLLSEKINKMKENRLLDKLDTGVTDPFEEDDSWLDDVFDEE